MHENGLDRKRILIVDDDVDILEAVSLLLQSAGYDTVTTSRGEETLTKVHACSPDMIVLDVLLSGHDGRDIAQKLKSHTRTNAIPIIMISAHPSVQGSVRHAGVEGFLPKPFDADDLLHLVRKFLYA